ncbi:Protein YciI [Roseobacter fucihabitans]|uniref:Protein YciI n=1 Tax=Roseobacter fucihabitans TaxID=1537242 RepID=A0ABZ2BZY9_9RHOB|nr:YciI family protein [Roseobacter litoralis]MBC6963901.1 YciI-like protein [Roseobacter litoralis]MBC6964014.1 YciI-like protein [Roseobacter litoralis]
MLIALIAHDKPGALPIRQENRPAHVAYLKSSDAVQQAGPLLDAQGEMAGSLIILDVEDIADAQAWVDGDPYGKAGLFASVELIPWNRVIG